MKLIHLLILVLLAPLGFALTLQLRVEPDQNNVCAGRLTGTWHSDAEVAKRLGLKADSMTIEFRDGEDFLEQVPAKAAKFLADKRIYESGVIVVRESDKVRWSLPYLLVTIAGNPHLMMFRERDGDPLGDVESFNLFVAHGKQRVNDLLLVGGDFNNQPFRPFRRAEYGK